MAKPKGATRSRMLQRIQNVIDLIVKHHAKPIQIIQALVHHPTEPVSEKTARRTLKLAKRALAALGSQPLAEERGIIGAQLDDLYAAEQASANPDRKLLIEILKTKLQHYKTNPAVVSPSKGGGETPVHHEPTLPHTQSTGLSPQLAKLLENFPTEGAS